MSEWNIYQKVLPEQEPELDDMKCFMFTDRFFIAEFDISNHVFEFWLKMILKSFEFQNVKSVRAPPGRKAET